MRIVIAIAVFAQLCVLASVQGQPECVTRVSPISGVKDDDSAIATCEGDEVMTDCVGVQEGSSHGTRDGEYIKKRIPECVARNGAGGTGVRAVARCCMWTGMQCVIAKGDRKPQKTATVSCDDHPIDGNPTFLTGCSARTGWQELNGAMPNAPLTGNLEPIHNQECSVSKQHPNIGSGVWAYGVCCTAPGLECKAKRSARSGGKVNDRASVECGNGWTLTGCNVYSDKAGTDGAFFGADACEAINGGNKDGVYAIAICCR